MTSTMPTYEDYLLPILQVVSTGEPFTKAVYEELLAERMQLTKEQREEQLPSQTQLTYKNRIGWAITHLVKAGLLERPQRATIQITPRGQHFLESRNCAPFRVSDLNIFAEHKEFVTKSTSSVQISVEMQTNDKSDTSPLERLETAHAELRNTLASDLIDSMKQMPPAAFEQLVVDVLVAMGYGGTITDAGQAIGRSGDGGIDGVIKEDRLGLDFIYVQAKRWENTIQRPQLQGFAGALLGRNAQRGVFITTSDFSQGAIDFAKSLPTNIVLVDGQQLAELMIDYGVGVIDEKTYRVKRVDPEYFGE